MGTHNRLARILVLCLTGVLLIAACLFASAPAMAARQAYVWLFATARTYLPGEQAELGIRGRGVSQLYLDIYRFDGARHFSESGAEAIWNVNPARVPGKSLVRTVNVRIPSPGGNLEASVKLDPLPPGAYVAVTRSRQLKQQDTVWFTVSGIGLISKQSAGRLLVYATDLKTGEPASGVPVRVQLMGQDDGDQPSAETAATRTATGMTDDSGLFSIPLSQPAASAMVTGGRGDEFAVLYSSFWFDARRQKIYIYTDRPIYRPNNTVCFKGIARTMGDPGYTIPGGQAVKVEIRDPRDNVLSKQELVTNDWGSFYGEFTLGSEPPLGGYSIIATIGGEQHWSSFSVAEYRKPEWSVDVKFDRDRYIAGDMLQATCEASYYFGAPVANARVEYRVYRQRVGSIGSAQSGADGDDGYGEHADYGYYGDYYEDFVTSGEACTDAQGRALISFEAPSADGRNYKYILAVDVVDATNKQASGSGSALVAMGLFDMRVSTSAYLVGPGDRFQVRVKTAGLDGSAVSRKLELVMMRRTYDKTGYTDTPVATCAAETSSSGEAAVELAAAEAGDYVLVARAVDERGNSIVAETHIWVSGTAGRLAAVWRSDVAVVCDKSSYKPGEVAKVLITAPADVSSVLLTVEDRDIRHVRVVQLENGSATVELPIVEEYAPNTYVTATAVASRVMQTASREISVAAPETSLIVEIQPNKASYRPGEVATYLVKTKNAQGDAVQAEISFGLVDESIYAVRPDTTPDIGKFFHGRRERGVSTENSFPVTYYGGADKGGGAESARKYFPDTAAWFPSVVTDVNGHAVLRVTMPDSLTTWRATVRAHARSTMVGQAQHKVVVTMPLSARLGLPRHYTLGDKAMVAGVVHNDTNRARRVSVTLRADGADVAGRSKQYVTVPAHGQASVEWEIEPRMVGKATLSLAARSWFLKDAVEMTVPVLPFGEENQRIWAGEARPSDESGALLEFELPRDALQGATRVQLEVSPGYAGVVQQALEFLVNYPYGCVEQTMSAFMPDIVAHRAFTHLGVALPRSQAELARMVDSGLARLYKYQHHDGGFGWWEFDQSDIWMTSYVLFGLGKAKEAGFDVSAQAIQRALDYLAESLARVRKADAREYAFASFVLAEHGRLEGASLSEFIRFGRQSHASSAVADPLTTAYITLAASRVGQDSMAAAGAQLLSARATRHSGQAYWQTQDTARWWRNETAESTAWAMMALLKVDPTSPLVAEAARHLASARTGSEWRSTRESAAAVLALVEYMIQAGDDVSAERKVVVSVNGEEAVSLTLGGAVGGSLSEATSASTSTSITVDPNLIVPGHNKIAVRAQGGAVLYSARAEWYAPQDQIEADGDCAVITREYFRIDRNAPAPKGQKYSVTPVDGEVGVREEVLVRVSVQALSDLEYMAFEDPVPSGFEISEESVDAYSWYYWYDRSEARDSKMVVFATRVPAGKTQTFEYVLVPERPGSYRVMPTQAWSMYYPGLRARGNSSSIAVTRLK
ncbi:MAG: hypothetical protein KA063_00770 [Firmicutes bacterium]|nr:hypothetical protein [Bacillota bacterium]